MKIVFNRYSLILILVLLIVIGFYFLKPKTDMNSQMDGQVERTDLIQRITLSGIIQPKHKALIIPPYDGYVKKIFVSVGDEVKAGAPLVSMAQSLSSEEETHPLRSPIKGVVVQVLKNEGEFVKSNTSEDFIIRVDDTNEMFVKVSAAEIDRLKILKDQEATLKPMALSDKTYKAKVTSLALAANEKDRWDRSSVVEFNILLKILDPDEQLHSGMSCLIDIITLNKKNLLTLRHEFILTENDKTFAILKNGKKVPIVLGVANEERAEILSGLKENETVQAIDFAKMIER